MPSNEKARGSGNEGLERQGIMGNVGTGSFVYDRVGGMGSEREYILEVSEAVVRHEGTETWAYREMSVLLDRIRTGRERWDHPGEDNHDVSWRVLRYGCWEEDKA